VHKHARTTLHSRALIDQRVRREPRLAATPFARKLLKPLNLDELCAEIAVVLSNRV
jgi:hypothetical protein